jgi:hypothetical protein
MYSVDVGLLIGWRALLFYLQPLLVFSAPSASINSGYLPSWRRRSQKKKKKKKPPAKSLGRQMRLRS